MTERTLRGNKLCAGDRLTVLAAYIHRGTIENAKRNPEAAGGKLPLISDDRWLEITDFAVTKSGRLDRRVNGCTTQHMEVPEHAAILKAFQTTCVCHL